MAPYTLERFLTYQNDGMMLSLALLHLSLLASIVRKWNSYNFDFAARYCFMSQSRSNFVVQIVAWYTISLSVSELTAGEVMYAVTAQSSSRWGTLYSVDIETGHSFQIGPRGMGHSLQFTVALAAQPRSGKLYLLDNTTEFGNLFSLDKVTGLAKPISMQEPVNELAFDSNGRLFTQLLLGDGLPSGPIGVFDLGAGQVESLDGDILPRLAGLAFNPYDGHLYGVTLTKASSEELLLKIALDGKLVSSIPLSPEIGVAGAVVFDRNGRLVGSNLASQLFEIDTITGEVSDLRNIFPRIAVQGLARSIPESPSFLLASTATVCLFFFRGRKS